jgi:hypothetical protein
VTHEAQEKQMNIAFRTNSPYRRTGATILTIFVILAIVFPATTSALALDPVPFVLANPADDFVHGYEWPLGTLVTMNIDNPSNGVGVDFTDTVTSVATWWNGPPTVAIFEFQGSFDLQPGHTITMTGNSITKIYTVTNLDITSVDVAADTISGVSTPGAQIRVCADNLTGDCRSTTANSGGQWTAGPSAGTFVLQAGAEIWAVEYNLDNDQTYDRWFIPAPQIYANPVENTVEARGMPVGTQLTMTINGGVYSSSATVAPAPWDASDLIARFPMGSFDLQAGQVIAVAGGGVSTTYTVKSFLITSVDHTANTISGKASPGAQVQVCANLPGDCVYRYPIADSNGNWMADFNQAGPRPDEQELFDIQGTSSGWGNESDAFRNQTWMAWSVTPVFADVHIGYWAWDFIERLYRAGITGGCRASPLQYCPEDTVTRAQMAVFLLRGIHTSAYTPPAVGAATGFGDVPANYWAGAFIKQLAAEGITSGCGGGNYCPEQAVTRAQMAVFLLKAKYGASYAPPPVGSSTGFGDVPPSYWAAAFIKQLVAEGITVGCGGGNYCPEQSVTRAQMAVFLVRTFSLP